MRANASITKHVVGRARIALAISNPPPGAIYLIDPTLRKQFQTLPLRAIGGSGALTWRVDGHEIGTADADAALRWPLAVGSHTIAVNDTRGRRATTTMLVK
jgi:membrane carboxypeptidase/penicillin-binding protein PbpC